MWESCNAFLEEQLKKRRRPGRKPVHLFAGVAFCHCGHKMYVPSNTPKYVCYKCRNKIPIQNIEAIFQEQIKQFLFSSDDIADYLGQTDAIFTGKTELISTLETEHKNVEIEMEKIYKLYMEDEISPDGFGKKYKPLEERLKQLDSQIPELQGEIDFLKIQNLSSEEIIADARDLHARWPNLSVEEKRTIIELVVDRITISKEAIDISLHHIPVVETSGNKAIQLQGFLAATN